jgi:hypothetical protein
MFGHAAGTLVHDSHKNLCLVRFAKQFAANDWGGKAAESSKRSILDFSGAVNFAKRTFTGVTDMHTDVDDKDLYTSMDQLKTVEAFASEVWSCAGFTPDHDRSWAKTFEQVEIDWRRHFPSASSSGETATKRRKAMGQRLRMLVLGLLHEALLVYNRFRRGPDIRAILPAAFRQLSSPSWDTWREYVDDLDRLAKQQRAENLDTAHLTDDAPVRGGAAHGNHRAGDTPEVADLKRKLAAALKGGEPVHRDPKASAPRVHGWTSGGKLFRVGEAYYGRAMAEQQIRDLGKNPSDFCIELVLMANMPVPGPERMKFCVHGASNTVDGHKEVGDSCHILKGFKASACRCTADGSAMEQGTRPPRGQPAAKPNGKGKGKPNGKPNGKGKGAGRPFGRRP